jgi:enoyl-CoA hydratase/carnithine racemase
MDYQAVILSVDGPVATITLNRPEALNALSPGLVRDLSQASGEMELRPEVKALVIRGAGRAFCTGADLGTISQHLDDPPSLASYVKDLNAMLFQLEELSLPVIGVVHGYALAAGLELLLACDLVIAAEDARIGDQHANYGLMPGGGSTQRLPRKLGHQRAMRLLMTGDWLSGKEAEEWGLVSWAVPPDRMDQKLEELLGTLRGKSREGLGWIKRTVQRGRNMSLRDGVALEVESFVSYLTTSPDPREGLLAFTERRDPKF